MEEDTTRRVIGEVRQLMSSVVGRPSGPKPRDKGRFGRPGIQRADMGAFLRGQGIATMAIDYFGPRGVIKNSSELSAPAIDSVDALKVIASDPRIDAKRIGVMGYSRSRIA